MLFKVSSDHEIFVFQDYVRVGEKVGVLGEVCITFVGICNVGDDDFIENW